MRQRIERCTPFWTSLERCFSRFRIWCKGCGKLFRGLYLSMIWHKRSRRIYNFKDVYALAWFGRKGPRLFSDLLQAIYTLF